MAKRIEILRRWGMKQKYYGRFIATNGETLAHTENYSNLNDLIRMLAVYFPNWPILLLRE